MCTLWERRDLNGDYCLLDTYTLARVGSRQPETQAGAAPLEERGKGGGTGRQACLAGKGEEKAKEPRFTGKIYWADQMHRGG